MTTFDEKYNTLKDTPQDIIVGDGKYSRPLSYYDEVLKDHTSQLAEILYSFKGKTFAEIQQAINDGFNLFTFYFPNTETNVYEFTDTLLLPSNTKIVISSGVTLKMANGVNKPLIKNVDSVNGNTGIEITGGKYDMNIANQTEQTPAIRFDKITHSKFRNMEVMGTKFVAYVGEGAFHLQDCDDNLIEYCEVHDSADDGLMIIGDRNKVIGGKYYNNGNGSGIADGGNENELHHVWCDANKGSNFSINSKYSKVLFCKSTNGTGNNAITLGHQNSPADGTIVQGCIVKDCNDGIRVLAGTKDAIIEGNQIENITRSTALGIGISDNAKDCIVRGNKVTNCWRGISAGGNTIVEANRVSKSLTTGIFLDNGFTHGVIANNISKNNDQSNVGGVGIYLALNATLNKVTGNQCFDDQTTKTQKRGIWSDGSFNDFDSNTCVDNVTAQMTLAADNTSSKNRLSKTDGFKFDVTLPSGTTVTINNSNITKDSNITWTPKTLGASNRNLFIYSRANGTFTLTLDAGGTTDVITVHID